MLNRKIALPHTSADLFITDGGMETTLIFLEGYELPCFAAFDLLISNEGYTALKNYYRQYLNIAKELHTNFILESPTWRANPDWLEKTGYPASALAEINTKAIQLLAELQKEFEQDIDNIVLSGCIGPRGDGYKPSDIMRAEEAEKYHAAQIEIFSHTPVHLVTAATMNYVEEAIGIARAASAAKLPSVISFTVETNGALATGMPLQEAIEQVDKHTSEPPLYYMLNCAHPTHFFHELQKGKNQQWVQRLKGIRANASCKSHAELDEATELDRGNPRDLGNENRKLKAAFNQLNVFGGCCGTDVEHVRAIATEVKSAE